MKIFDNSKSTNKEQTLSVLLFGWVFRMVLIFFFFYWVTFQSAKPLNWRVFVQSSSQFCGFLSKIRKTGNRSCDLVPLFYGPYNWLLQFYFPHFYIGYRSSFVQVTRLCFCSGQIYTSSHDQSVLVLLLGSWTVFNISPPNTSAASKQSYDAFPLRLDSSNIQWTRNEFYLTSGTRAVCDSSQMNWHKSVRLAGVTEGLESGVWVRWHEVLWKRYWHPFTPLHSFPNTHTPTVSKFLCARKWQDPSEIKSRVY